MISGGVMILPLIVIAAVVVMTVLGLVLLAVFGGRAGRIVAGILGGGLAILVLAAVGWFSITVGDNPEVVTSVELADPMHIEVPGDITQHAALPADVYPSQEQALKGVARRFADRLFEIAPNSDYDQVVVSGEAPESLKHLAGLAVRDSRLADAYVLDKPDGPDGGEVLSVELLCPGDPNAEEGLVELRSRIYGRWIDASARYVRKDWLVDLPAFRREHPKDQWHVIDPIEMYGSRRQAREAALQEATNRLMPQALVAVQELVHRNYRSPLRQPDLLEVRAELGRRLRSGSMISDEFAQQIDRPYATMYRTSLLVREDPLALSEIASTVTHRRDSVARGWLWTAGSVGGVSVIVLLVYLLLNAATRGYYTWSLRIGAVALAVGGAVLVLLAV